MIDHQNSEMCALVDETEMADILVVEDDPEINELIGAYVQLSGYSCRRVMRGDDALREAADHPPALVILDVMLPTWMVLRSVADCARPGQHRPCRSSCSPPSTRTRCERGPSPRGATDYLTKPFDPDRLISAIREWSPH